jgi:hypothetical protein
MFTGLKTQHELTDCFINDIVPNDHDLVKLQKVLNWGGSLVVTDYTHPPSHELTHLFRHVN